MEFETAAGAGRAFGALKTPFLAVLLSLSAVVGALGAASVAHGSGYTFTINESPNPVQQGAEAAVRGTVCPNPDAPLGAGGNVTYTAPNGTQFYKTLNFGYSPQLCSGQFSVDTEFLTGAGTWSVTAWVYWQDYNTGTYYQVESNAVSFQVGQTAATTTTTTSTATSTAPGASSSPVTGAGNVTLQYDHFEAYPVDVAATSYVLWYTLSNVSVSGAFMSAAEFASFDAGTSSISSSLASQNGTETFDGLLVPAGDYYFTICACSGSALVSYDYDASLSLAVTNETTSVGVFVTVPPDSSGGPFSLLIHNETLGSTSRLSVFGASNETLVYELYDRTTGTDLFTSAPVTTTNVNGTVSSPASFSPTYNFSLPVGSFALFVTNPHQAPAYLYVSYSLKPAYANPYLWASTRDTEPTGIASFGLLNDSGRLTPYTINTRAVAGFVNVTSLASTDVDQLAGPWQHSSSIQLNAIVLVNNTDGSQFSYWAQNVPGFFQVPSGYQVPQGHYFNVEDNVWNDTGDGASLYNNTIYSRDYGTTGSGGPGYGNYYYECVPTDCNSVLLYELPFAFAMGMNVTAIPGQGLAIGMSIEVLQNGTAVQDPQTYWYDYIMIPDPGISTATFHISGTNYTPAGIKETQGVYYDAELVWGGYSGGDTATFQQLDSNLGLYYMNSTGQAQAFPSYYSFGSDTAESTPSLHVRYLGDGQVDVAAATPNYVYLTNPAGGPGGVTTTTAPGPGASTQKASPPAPGAGYLYYVIPVAVAAVVVAAIFVARTRGGRGLPPPPPPPP